MSIRDQWNKVDKLKCFEIPLKVEGEYSLCWIELIGVEGDETFQTGDGSFISSVDYDPDFTLDEHLEQLYDKCINALTKQNKL